MNPDDFLNSILDQLPEERQGEERRKHSLTRADLRLLSLLIDEKINTAPHPCALNMNADSAAVLHDWADTLLQIKKWSIRGIIIIVGAIVWGVVNMFLRHDMVPRGWWQK